MPFDRILLASLLVLCLGACGDGDDHGHDGGHLDTSPPPQYAFRDDAPTAYTRVDRMGNPALSTALVPSVRKEDFNDANPNQDGTFAIDLIGTLTALHDALDPELAGLGLDVCAAATTCVAQAQATILGPNVTDTLKLDPAAPAGFPNGRRLTDQVIDLTLAVAFLDLAAEPVTAFADLPLNPPMNDKTFGTGFPYLAPPHTP